MKRKKEAKFKSERHKLLCMLTGKTFESLVFFFVGSPK